MKRAARQILDAVADMRIAGAEEADAIQYAIVPIALWAYDVTTEEGFLELARRAWEQARQSKVEA